MKRVSIFGLMVFFMALASGALASQTIELTFEWEQPEADFPNLREWGLYIMDTSGGVQHSPIVIPYVSGAGPFQATSSFTVTGAPGATVRRYFVLDAVSKNGTRSENSNEVFYDFVMPSADVTVPIKLKVTVTIK